MLALNNNHSLIHFHDLLTLLTLCQVFMRRSISHLSHLISVSCYFDLGYFLFFFNSHIQFAECTKSLIYFLSQSSNLLWILRLCSYFQLRHCKYFYETQKLFYFNEAFLLKFKRRQTSLFTIAVNNIKSLYLCTFLIVLSNSNFK